MVAVIDWGLAVNEEAAALDAGWTAVFAIRPGATAARGRQDFSYRRLRSWA
jgi:hypothetical protein